MPHCSINAAKSSWYLQADYRSRDLCAAAAGLGFEGEVDALHRQGYTLLDLPGVAPADAALDRALLEVARASAQPVAFSDTLNRWVEAAELPALLAPETRATVRFVNVHTGVPLLAGLVAHPRLSALLDVLAGSGWQVLKSSCFLRGSEVPPHADLPYIPIADPTDALGVWIALEPADERNGAVCVYPGTHDSVRWFDFGGGNALMSDTDPQGTQVPAYTRHVHVELQRTGVRPVVLTVATGTAAVWHAATVHCGLPIADWSRTRRSLVLIIGRI